MKNDHFLRGLSAAALYFLAVNAQAVTIDAIDRGWYASNGFHGFYASNDPGNLNYFAGEFEPGRFGMLDFRNFFVFDLGSVSGTVTSAALRLFNGPIGYISIDATETYELHHVATSAASLIAGTAGVAGYTDLGNGTVYGSRDVSFADNDTFITLTLNAAAIADVNAASGNLFALGGLLTTSVLGGDFEGVFGFSADLLSDTQLVLETTAAPEPASLALLGLGLAGIGISRWRAKKD